MKYTVGVILLRTNTIWNSSYTRNIFNIYKAQNNTNKWTPSFGLCKPSNHLMSTLNISTVWVKELLTICEGVEGFASDIQSSEGRALGLGGPPAGQGSL